MLVKLKTPSGRFVQVINTDANSPMDGAELHVLGFNRESPTTLFSSVQTNTVAFKLDSAACANHFDEMTEGTDTMDDSLVFCTSTFAACHGHEGSPVVDQRGRLVGMVAGGTDCDPRIPMLNIRASAFAHFMHQGVCAMSNQPLASCPQRPVEAPPAIEAEDGAASSAAIGESSMDAGVGRRRLQEQDFAEAMDETVVEGLVDESFVAGYVDETIYTTTAVEEISADEVETVVGGYVDETIDPLTTEEDEGDADGADTALVIVEVIDRTDGWDEGDADEGDADEAADQSMSISTEEGEGEALVVGDSYMVLAVVDADDEVTTHIGIDDDLYIDIDDEEEAWDNEDEFAENDDDHGTDDGYIIGTDHFSTDDGSIIGTDDDDSSIGTDEDAGIISNEDDGPTRTRFLRGFVLLG
jgi:hypothetical protein